MNTKKKKKKKVTPLYFSSLYGKKHDNFIQTETYEIIKQENQTKKIKLMTLPYLIKY